MDIKEISVEQLIPYEFNNKLHDATQVNRIANSIKEFWFLQPLVIDKNNVVIVGHGRLEWAKKLWLKTVPCLMAENLTEQQIKKYRILDNKLNESEWDVENLKLELDELPDLDFWDLHLEVSDLFPDLKVEETETEVEEDEAPEVEATAKVVEYWDIFQLWNHRLMCWDSTKVEDVESLMWWELASIVYTDPPYWMNLDTDYSDMKWFFWKSNKFDKVIWDTDDFKPELITTIFDNFWYCKEMFMWWADYYAEIIQNRNEWSWVVWDKSIDDSWDKMFWSNFELCWSKNRHKRDLARIKWKWLFWMEKDDTKSRIHPTQKPVLLANRFLSKYSNEWDIVVDLYWWSWSTLIACDQLKRRCFMNELDPRYIEAIIKRFHNLNPNAEIKCLNREADLSCILENA